MCEGTFTQGLDNITNTLLKGDLVQRFCMWITNALEIVSNHSSSLKMTVIKCEFQIGAVMQIIKIDISRLSDLYCIHKVIFVHFYYSCIFMTALC